MTEENQASARRVTIRAARHQNLGREKVQLPNIPDSFFPITSREDFQRKAAALLAEDQRLTISWTVTREHPTSILPPPNRKGRR